MEKQNKSSFGVSAITVTVEFNDAIAIAMLLNKLDEYEAKLAKYNEWAAQSFNPETGERYPEPENPIGSWDTEDFITKAKNILRQLTFVNIGESNVFDEDWTKSDNKRARKAYK